METQVILWVFGIVFSLAQMAFLFLWNNLRADIKVLSERLEGKASLKSMEERRTDIKELFERDDNMMEKLNTMEKNLIEQINQLTITLLRCQNQFSGDHK